jgi:hypothetical protein
MHFYGAVDTAAIVSLILFAAAIIIAVESVKEISPPHHAPAPFTLVVLILDTEKFSTKMNKAVLDHLRDYARSSLSTRHSDPTLRWQSRSS